MPEKPKLENAKTEIFGFGVLFSLTRHLILSLPLGEMSRSDREGCPAASATGASAFVSLVRELDCRFAARLREFYRLTRYACDLP